MVRAENKSAVQQISHQKPNTALYDTRHVLSLHVSDVRQTCCKTCVNVRRTSNVLYDNSDCQTYVIRHLYGIVRQRYRMTYVSVRRISDVLKDERNSDALAAKIKRTLNHC